jgi:hypothetical protein
MHTLTAVFPQIFFHERTPKIIFDIPRNPQLQKSLKAIKSWWRRTQFNLHLNIVKKKFKSCYTNQFTLQNNEAYFEGYLEFLRYSEISVYSTISLGTPLVFCRILTMQYTDNLFFPDLTMLNYHKTHTRHCHLWDKSETKWGNVRNKWLYHRAAICEESPQGGSGRLQHLTCSQLVKNYPPTFHRTWSSKNTP